MIGFGTPDLPRLPGRVAIVRRSGAEPTRAARCPSPWSRNEASGPPGPHQRPEHSPSSGPWTVFGRPALPAGVALPTHESEPQMVLAAIVGPAVSVLSATSTGPTTTSPASCSGSPLLA